MDLETIRGLSLSRHLYELGVTSLRSKNDLHLFSAANLLQDSVEAFLITLADHVGASIDPNTKFDKYFVSINEKIAPKELPFKLKLLRLNRIRIDSKHYAIQPARDECERLAVVVREFFDEVSTSHLGVAFSTVSAIDLLEDGETKTVLLEARAALEAGDHPGCAIGCRKAIFLEIEHYYDISRYKDAQGFAALAIFTLAPLFACNKEYVETHVKDPTDFVVYDHSDLDQKLLTQGVDITAFWNVWRLTPEVYKTNDGRWVVKYAFDKLDADLLADKIEYIFSTTIDIILAIHTNRRAVKTSRHQLYFIDLMSENVPIFQKADKTSTIVGTTPAGMTRIDTDFRVDGLHGDGPYFHVIHFENDLSLYGFIHIEHVGTPG